MSASAGPAPSASHAFWSSQGIAVPTLTRFHISLLNFDGPAEFPIELRDACDGGRGAPRQSCAAPSRGPPAQAPEARLHCGAECCNPWDTPLHDATPLTLELAFVERGLRLAGFPHVLFYYNAGPCAQFFSIPSIAHGSMRLASLAAGVVCPESRRPDGVHIFEGLASPAKPLDLVHGSATSSQRRESPSLPSPPPCFLVSRLAGTPNLASY
ncbi:hypothetical protein FDECE_17774 [Fusarium decemcellulare]|nr:hypothetical protein FDECE_17774 [Fusarium decemcellulare]